MPSTASLQSREAVEGICDQRRLWVDIQADLSHLSCTGSNIILMTEKRPWSEGEMRWTIRFFAVRFGVVGPFSTLCIKGIKTFCDTA